MSNEEKKDWLDFHFKILKDTLFLNGVGQEERKFLMKSTSKDTLQLRIEQPYNIDVILVAD